VTIRKGIGIFKIKIIADGHKSPKESSEREYKYGE
jgi:hypothetical protein